MVHEFRHVPNTSQGTSGSQKGGSGSDVDFAANLFCGAQALAMADIGLPEIVEDTFDYGNQNGISIGKIMGLKPATTLTFLVKMNFGVIRVDCAF